MKLMALSQGKFARVDDADFDFLSQWKWSAMRVKKAATVRFYAVRVEMVNGKQQMILMHRALTGAPKGKVVDHRDHDTLNNQRGNLRVCTQASNMLNATAHADAGSRFKGVFWHKQNRKWVTNFRGKYIGSFSDEGLAAAAYDAAAEKHNPEFALTNAALAGEVCHV